MSADPAPLVRRLLLVRHQPTALAPGTCYGRLDAGLHPDSLAALPALADHLARARPARVWSSPARRCLLLARAVAERAGAALVTDPRLRELDFGAWEGLPWTAVPRPELDRWAADPLGFAPPGGEGGAALLARVRAVAAELARGRGVQVVVSHGGPLRLLPSLLRGLPPRLLEPAPAMGEVLDLVLTPDG